MSDGQLEFEDDSNAKRVPRRKRKHALCCDLKGDGSEESGTYFKADPLRDAHAATVDQIVKCMEDKQVRVAVFGKLHARQQESRLKTCGGARP